MNLTKYFSILFVSLFGALSIYSCAAVQAPSGGPKDETPPELIQSVPDNGTIFFPGGRVELVFSEYLSENSIANAITVMPKLKEDPELIYKGRRVFVNFPDSLLSNQTYIISIDRSLKDEHGVFLEQGLQVAYATGAKINEGSVTGTIKHIKPASAQLWKIKSEEDLSLFYQREPDYVLDAADNGSYRFQFLSSGAYKLASVDQSVSETAINPDRTVTGLPWEAIIQLGTDETVTGMDMMIPERSGPNRMNRAEWVTGTWFKLFFSENVSDLLNLLPVQVFAEGSIFPVLDLFLDNEDKTMIHIILSESIPRPGLVAFALNSIQQGEKTLLDSSRVAVRTDTTRDTTNAKISFPVKSYIHPIEEEMIVPLKINFSSFMEKSKTPAPITLMQDSISVPLIFNWISPLTLEITPEANWNPKTNYKLHIYADELHPVYGKTLSDSVATMSFKTSNFIRFGHLLGQVESKLPGKVVAQVKYLEKEPEDFHTVVNLDGTFAMNRLREGNYSLLFFEDSDGDNRYSYGSLDPYKPAEWFFIYPDTVEIRGNWDMELTGIQFEKRSL